MADSVRIVVRRTDLAGVYAQIFPKMVNLGEAVAVRAQRLVPKDTWALHDSIGSKTTGNGRVIKTVVSAGGEGVGYALYVEQGTSIMAAQPYLRPAALQTKAGDFSFEGGVSMHGIARSGRRSARYRRRS